MKNLYENFFIPSQSRNDFLTQGKGISSNKKSAVKMNHSVCSAFTWLLVHLQVCRVSTSLLQFSCKLAISHCQTMVESANRFIALDKRIKKYLQEQQTRAKTWARKVLKKANKLCCEHYWQRVLPSKEMSWNTKQMTYKKARQGK